MNTKGTNLGTSGRRRKNLAGPGFSRRQKRKGKERTKERKGVEKPMLNLRSQLVLAR